MIVALVVLAVLSPSLAHACPVCFGAADTPMTHGMNNGILVMLAVVVGVQGGFLALFLSLRRRAGRLGEQGETLQRLQGGA
ncbi:MAG: hypothetical protein ACE5HV_04095 [Acidobacteriota bacterium]